MNADQHTQVHSAQEQILLQKHKNKPLHFVFMILHKDFLFQAEHTKCTRNTYQKSLLSKTPIFMITVHP